MRECKTVQWQNVSGENEVRQLNNALTKTQHLLEEAREKEEAAIALELDIRAQFNKLSASYDEAQSRYCSGDIFFAYRYFFCCK